MSNNDNSSQASHSFLWLMLLITYVTFYLCRVRRRRMYFNEQRRRRRQQRDDNNNNRNDNPFDTIAVDGVNIPRQYQSRFHGNPEERKEFILERIIIEKVESKIASNENENDDKTDANETKSNHDDEDDEENQAQNVVNNDQTNYIEESQRNSQKNLTAEEEKSTEEAVEQQNNTNTEENVDANADGNNVKSPEKSYFLMSIGQSILDGVKSTLSPKNDSNEEIASAEMGPKSHHNFDDAHELKNLCPICLTDFAEGQEICYSSNKDCPHSFHLDCMVEWLMKHDDCPLCRQDYLKETEVVDKPSFEEDIDLDRIQGGDGSMTAEAGARGFQRNASFRYNFRSEDSDGFVNDNTGTTPAFQRNASFRYDATE